MPRFTIRKKDEPHKYWNDSMKDWGRLAMATKYWVDGLSVPHALSEEQGGEWELQPKRWKDSEQISGGAVNVLAIANAIRNAAQEVDWERGDAHKDAAIMLMVHQLAHLTGADRADRELTVYAKALAEVRDRVSEVELYVSYNSAVWTGDAT